MPDHDQLHRYLFQNHAVRGELVTVSETYQQILANHDYPPEVQKLLGELLAATSLLSATLKVDADITVQIQGDGPLKLAVVNSTHQQEMRAVARVQGEIREQCPLKEMVGNGVIAITITPLEGERYQGIVALEGETLAQCLEHYFYTSEQLPTHLIIRTGLSQGKPIACGLLLQVLPTEDVQNLTDFEHLVQLTDTIKNDELFDLPATEVLYRLYHQENVILYQPQKISFRCTCSWQHCADALLKLPKEEVAEMIEQDGNIDMHCDYCGNHYVFGPEDITALYNGPDSHEHQIH